MARVEELEEALRQLTRLYHEGTELHTPEIITWELCEWPTCQNARLLLDTKERVETIED